jgi:hypothetical protein
MSFNLIAQISIEQTTSTAGSTPFAPVPAIPPTRRIVPAKRHGFARRSSVSGFTLACNPLARAATGMHAGSMHPARSLVWNPIENLNKKNGEET